MAISSVLSGVMARGSDTGVYVGHEAPLEEKNTSTSWLPTFGGCAGCLLGSGRAGTRTATT